jgi:hypothetical protein
MNRKMRSCRMNLNVSKFVSLISSFSVVFNDENLKK